MKNLNLVLVIVLALTCFTSRLLAQNLPRVTIRNPGPRQKQPNLTAAQRKIDTLIRRKTTDLKAAGITASNAASRNAARQFSTRLIKVNNRGMIQIYLQLTEVNPARLAALRAIADIDIELTNEGLQLLQCWAPYEKIEALAALNFVVRVRRPQYGTPQSGSVTSEGDTILNADQVRSTLGITGAGTKVGVISAGANHLADSQATGDLPPSITVFGSCDLASWGFRCDEGTAMMENIYDLALGVSLAIGDATTSLDFIQRVTDLEDWGADVIVDDFSFFDAPYFEDGPIAMAYADALADGIVMVSSAGNYAQVHYQGVYVDSGGINFHDFGGGDITMHFTMPQGNAGIILQWSNRFGQSADDYDLCLTDASVSTVYDCAQDEQNGTQDPIEILVVGCDDPSGCAGNVAIYRYAGAVRTLEMFFLGATPTEHVVQADSIFGHQAVPGVMSVGAIRASDPGNLNIETYSSRGPSTVLSGSPRPTPTLTTIDCVSDTGAGGFPMTFCGTSASAPHAAAVAALVLQANPRLTPGETVSAMQETASDRGPAGYDNTYGAGLVNAFPAVSQNKKRSGQITSLP